MRAPRRGPAFLIVSLAFHGTLLAALSFVQLSGGASSDAQDGDNAPFLMQLDLRPTSFLAQHEEEAPPPPVAESAPEPKAEPAPREPEPLVEVDPEPSPEPVSAPAAVEAPVVTTSAAEAPATASAPAHMPSELPPGDAPPSSAAPVLLAGPSGPPVPPAAGTPGATATAGGDALDDGLHLRAVRADKPEFPEEARRRNEEGRVTCRLTIDRDGRVIEVEVVTSSGSKSLDAAAVRTLKRWRFEPLARLTDRPTVHALQTLSFELKTARR